MLCAKKEMLQEARGAFRAFVEDESNIDQLMLAHSLGYVPAQLEVKGVAAKNQSSVSTFIDETKSQAKSNACAEHDLLLMVAAGQVELRHARHIRVQEPLALGSLNLKATNDDDLAAVAGVAKHSRQVSISCRGVSDKGLKTLAKACSRLRRISLRDCKPELIRVGCCVGPQVDPAMHYAIIVAGPLVPIILGCFRFGAYPATRLYTVSDAGLIAIARHCSELQHIDIDMSWTHITVAGIEAVARGCSRVRHIGLFGHGKITDSHLNSLRQKYPGISFECEGEETEEEAAEVESLLN